MDPLAVIVSVKLRKAAGWNFFNTKIHFDHYNPKSISLATSVGLRQRNSILDTRFDQYDTFLQYNLPIL